HDARGQRQASAAVRTCAPHSDPGCSGSRHVQARNADAGATTGAVPHPVRAAIAAAPAAGTRMTRTIDLNCDIGESFGAWTMGDDAGVLAHVSSASIACGFHAGDPDTMCSTVALALRAGVAIGAHVSLPDLAGFGRREMQVSPAQAHALTLYQLGALAAFARAAGSRLHHVKPHGALYNMAARDAALADAIADAVRA